MTKSTFCAIAVLCLGVSLPSPASAQNVGSSTGGDLPEAYGRFSLVNKTGMAVHYDIQWGNEPTRSITLLPGHRRTHAHRLDGEGRAPTPHIRFRFLVAGNQQVPLLIGAIEDLRMSFFRAFIGGFGPVTEPARPKPYQFVLSPDRSRLDVRELP
jgi:hypothetical protein